ncbi:MAG: hypothetical protein ACLP01_23425 [Solirubrobacteraceae bacterium]
MLDETDCHHEIVDLRISREEVVLHDPALNAEHVEVVLGQLGALLALLDPFDVGAETLW